MADIKAKDKMHSTNDEVKREDDFQDALNQKEEIYEMIKELLEKTTEDVFFKAGFERIENPTSEYATGKPYGYGAEEGKYQIRLAGRTKASIEKQIIFGAKKLESQIKMAYKGNILNIEYETPEAGFFRGVDPEKGDRKTYMVNKTINLPIKNKKDLEKAFKNMFENAAQKELAYIMNTKLGVEDKTDVGTASTVEESIKSNNNMKKFTLKEIFEEDFEEKEEFSTAPNDEDFEETEEFSTTSNEEKNIEKIIDLNTQPISSEESEPKFLLFDIEEEPAQNIELEEILNKYEGINKEEMRGIFNKTMKEKFGTNNFKALTPVEKKELFNTIDDRVISSEEQIEEITATGPAIAGGFKDGANSGSGGYNAKSAFKKTGGSFKRQMKSSNRKQTPSEKAGKPWNIPVNDPIYEEGDSLFEEEHKSKFLKTSYAKTKSSKRPKVDKDYNIIKEEKDNFWTPVKIDPNYHPLGMPFVKPGSKEEWDRTSGGGKPGKDFDKLKRIGMEENEDIPNTNKKETKLKRKFTSEVENLKEGVNKKYIICEKTTTEYEKERWSKLVGHKLYETIEKDEEFSINEEIEQIFEEKTIIPKEIKTKTPEVLSEETVLVEKPNTKFGLKYKFYKKDFLNENKDYILDLNAYVFVRNPRNIK